MKILITGTPGVGKTTLANKISLKFNLENIETSNFIIKNNLFESYNEALDTLEFKTLNVKKQLKSFLKNKNNFIIDTHTVQLIKFIKFDFVFVLTLDNELLYKRLVNRNYPPAKIKENIECEIFHVIEERCYEFFKNVKVICTDNLSENEVFDFVIEKLKP